MFSTDFSRISKLVWDNETIVARGSIERYVYSLFCFVWPIFRMVIPALLITSIYQKHNASKFSLFLAFGCLIVPALLLGGDNIAPFIGMFVAMMVIIKFYGRRTYKYLVVAAVCVCVPRGIVINSKIVAMTQWRGATGIAVFAQMLHNYFPGFDNMAVIFELGQENMLSTLFFDMYYAIPFRNTLFGLEGKYIQDLFREYTLTGGQIVPFTGQMAYYLGYGAVFITGFFVILAYKAEYKSKITDNFWQYFVNMYFSFYTAMAICIYSFSIYLSGLINVVLPIWIISKTVKRYSLRKVKE